MNSTIRGAVEIEIQFTDFRAILKCFYSNSSVWAGASGSGKIMETSLYLYGKNISALKCLKVFNNTAMNPKIITRQLQKERDKAKASYLY